MRTQASVRTIARTHQSHGVLWSSARSRDMYSSSSSPSLTMTVRILNSHTNASSTDASESPWCVCCGNLNITTALGGVLCQIASIPYVLGSDVLKSFTFSSPPTPATFQNCSRQCSRAPHPPFPTSFPLYTCFPFSFSAVLPLTFRQSLHVLICRWCSQRPPPLQSLHLLLCRWCSQMLLPPQSLHVLLCRWCSQRLLPPQSLQLLLRRWCSQKLKTMSEKNRYSRI